MTLTCTKCHRTNPKEASYCYYDGSILPGHGGNGGPLNAGAQLFTREFVFPSGRRCRNFDELALGCVQEWSSAVELLQNGWLESFLGGIGRADLAVVAKQASKFPDRERGLDMLIDKLPSRVVEPPKLQAEPQAINLGQIKIGEDRKFELRIANQGTRLLYGTVTVEKGVWLALGEEPGVPEKSFQCEHEVVIPVLIRGKQLKADAKKPLEGKLQVESSGGSAEVLIKVDVPVKAFPDGLLAGARTQRELAERAFKQPQEAATLFENGSVARWYADNGWDYVVQGPTATGLGAVQQFLEACGLATAPKVECDTSSLKIHGTPGQRLKHVITVKGIEKKPVFAYAISDQPWLVPQQPTLKGRTATLPIEIQVPPQGPQTLAAKLTVISNGRQRFAVPATLDVAPGMAQAFAFGEAPMVVAAAPAPAVALFEDDDEGPAEPTTYRRRDERVPWWVHATPAMLLALVLLAILVIDGFRKGTAGGDEEEIDKTLYIEVGFPQRRDINNQQLPRLPHRFGLRVPNQLVDKDREDIVLPGEDKKKKLTFDSKGVTNNTCIRIDGKDYLFAQKGDGEYGKEHDKDPYQPVEYAIDPAGVGWRSYWDYPDYKVRVIQDVSIRPNDQTGKLDTCLVKYTLENKDSIPHSIGLRFMLDTFIGANDGVPFAIPGKGKEGLCDTKLMFDAGRGDEMPDYIEALEKADLQKPGTVARVTLKLGLPLPTRVQLSAWPDPDLRKLAQTPDLPDLSKALGPLTRWEVPFVDIKILNKEDPRKAADSAVIIYWDPQEIPAGKSREIGFAYGLGTVESEGGGKLAISVGGSFKTGGEFTVIALVNEPQAGQTAKLNLPKGLKLAGGESATKDVPLAGSSSRNQSTVSWKVRGEVDGKHKLTVQLSSGVSKEKEVRIKASSFLD